MSTDGSRGEVVWRPGPDDGRRLASFTAFAARQTGRSFGGYDELWRWSVDDLEGFWGALTAWSGVRWHERPERVLAGGDRSMPGARWFPGATLNYAEHALARAAADPAGVAVVAVSQTRPRRELSWAGLADAVARCRVGLRRLGVGRGDRVAAYAPNIPETLVAFLATASLGAVWVSCPPEFGVRAVVDRLSQVRPGVLLAVDGYRYGTRDIDRRDEVAAIAAAVGGVRHVVPLRYLGPGEDGWAALTAEAGPPAFDPVPADHPLYVLFSSGTTGLPKPLVHGHGGITVEHLKALALHHDLGPGRRFCWFTTTGWMMWNYLVSGLATGAAIVLFDGDPGAPDLGTLWRLAADERLDLLGVSAPFLLACRKAGLAPASGSMGDLSGLRSVGSTGSPLPAAGATWVRDAVGAQVQVASISGGTDVCTAFVGGVPTLPVRAGEITRPLLGCDVRAVDGAGRRCPPGVTGELVVAAPMPSMPVALWGDDDGSRLRAAYFTANPGVWTHGDWITVFDDGACAVTGRSDATLNRGGVRLGTSDFYAVVEALAEVDDSLVVHLDHLDPDGGPADPMGELVLFVVPAGGVPVDDDLRGVIAAALRTQLSPRHVPDRIEAVPAVPRTLSGKKLEVPVKRILSGEPPDAVVSRDALADPGALDHFQRLAPDARPARPAQQGDPR
jgi:acetoacetyl-CoA synthetase